MKRYLVLALCAAGVTAACSPRVRPTDVVVRVGEHRLTVQHLTALVHAMRPDTGRAAAVHPAVERWIDYTLAGAAIAGHPDFPDSAFLADVLAPRQAAEYLLRLGARLASRRPGLPAGETERIFASDSVRVLRQILIPVSSWQNAVAVSAAKKLSDSVLGLRSAGQPFEKLARRFSLVVGPYGGQASVVWKRTVPADARRSLWALEQGAIVTARTPLGFVLVYRPLLREVRAELTSELLRAVNARADSVFADSVVRARAPRLLPASVARFRRVLDEPTFASDSDSLATFQGGMLSSRRALVWLGLLQDQVQGGMGTQSDSALSRVLAWMARNELLVQVARGLAIDVSWGELTAYRAEVLTLLGPLKGQFAGVAGAEALSRHVDSLVTALGQGRNVPTIPGGIAVALRRRVAPAIDPRVLSAVDHVFQLAGQAQRPAPSTGTPFEP